MSGEHPSTPAGTSWNPRQYHKFTDHRLRPALELLDRIPLEQAALVYDLGSGSGNVTRIIADRFTSARVVGVEISDEMISQARATPSRVEWQQANVATWSPERPPDVIFSNATLHWVDDHPKILPRLLDGVTAGGYLAVQMPLSFPMRSHALMRETLADGALDGGRIGDEALAAAVGRKWVLDADEYYDMLAPGAESIDIWETEYLQLLIGDDPVLEWVKSTGLRPILNGLVEADRDRFLEVYAKRLRDAYPRRADARTLYPFRRLFIVAKRSG